LKSSVCRILNSKASTSSLPTALSVTLNIYFNN
jgi:hypothetical protein